MDYAKESLRMHYEWKGKLEVVATVPVATKEDLSLAYTPGVAQPCVEISKDVNKSYELTRRHNLCAVITDGRFSVATRGAAIGHVSPEAASGGMIGLVEEGDIIAIDIPACSVTLKVSDDELAARRASWVAPAPKVTTGYAARYAKLVSSADKGAIINH